MYRRFTVVAFLALIVASLPTLGARAAGGIRSGNQQLQAINASPLAAGRVTGPAATAMQRGALPSDAAELARLKAQGAAGAGQGSDGSQATGPQGTVVAGASKAGLFDPSGAPSDSTGAIGTASYIEVVNSKVGLFNRTTLAAGVSATLGTWWGAGSASVFDPQVIWDPTTNRFYYAGDVVVSANENYLAFGWSTTAAPANFTTNWCRYFVRWDDTSTTPATGYFPDYPKLGDSQSFIHVGVNTFKGNPYVGSDLLSVLKPAAGTTCAAASTLKLYAAFGLKIGTAFQFTPVPANEIDTSATGYVVTRSLSLPGTTIGIFKVTKNATTGAAVVTAVGTAAVPSYTAPPNAPQSGTIALIDTSDARMTQAVAAVDPAHANQFAVWTQHTIKNASGIAAVKWYEINPATRVIIQSGLVSNTSLYYFNGAVSPDRVVRGTVRAFGGSMVLNYNSSSTTTFPRIYMVSKRGTGAVSAPTLVKASPGPIIEFNCKAAAPNNVCRWGDYAAATPDPLAPNTGSPTPVVGFVYNTSQWTKDSRLQTTPTVNWQTWNWKAQP